MEANIVQTKEVFVFDLDDVLYPEKDYLLQVYYLFSEFIEYTAQQNAKKILEFMRATYTAEGSTGLFAKTAAAFQLPEKYAENFRLLHSNARLPLKLLLFQNILSLLQEIVTERKKPVLLVSGDSEMQLNKIRQIEWNGLEKYITVYFLEELGLSVGEGLQMIAEKHEIKQKQLIYFNKNI